MTVNWGRRFEPWFEAAVATGLLAALVTRGMKLFADDETLQKSLKNTDL